MANRKQVSWFPLWVFPVLIAIAIGTVWLRLAIVSTTYSIDETERMIRSLKQARERSELKLASLRSPRRLELLAKTRYSLQAPHSDQVVHLK